MTYHTAVERFEVEVAELSARRDDPRALMAERLPRIVQPFLTWLTARPAPGETLIDRAATSFVWEAALTTLAGTTATVALCLWAGPAAAVLGVPLAWLVTTYGLGLFQVVIFHHASHNTVFASKEANRRAGWLISAVLLFKHFDHYKKEHLRHHSANALLTDEDEFADFVLGMCRLEPGVPKRELWRRVLLSVTFSPAFHARFLGKRVRAAVWSPDRAHNALGLGVWLAGAALAAVSGYFGVWLLAWVIPVTVLLQMATVGRILCEHRFPDAHLIEARGREFVCDATSGVFPGSPPPEATLGSAVGWLRWAAWWADMLGVQLFVRLFVLVGDAPCHDHHHRRPATRRWTSYIAARQADVDAGCPGYPRNYAESWGLFRALDDSLGTLAKAPAHLSRPAAGAA